MEEKESQEKDNHNLYSQRCPAHSVGRTPLTLPGTESNCKQRERQRPNNIGQETVKDHIKWKFGRFFDLRQKKLKLLRKKKNYPPQQQNLDSTDLHNMVTNYENCILADCLRCYDILHYFKYFCI